jgi:hypothetical protein
MGVKELLLRVIHVAPLSLDIWGTRVADQVPVMETVTWLFDWPRAICTDDPGAEAPALRLPLTPETTPEGPCARSANKPTPARHEAMRVARNRKERRFFILFLVFFSAGVPTLSGNLARECERRKGLL